MVACHFSPPHGEPLVSIDNDAKNGGKEFLPRCIAFFNQIPIESFRICNSSMMHP